MLNDTDAVVLTIQKAIWREARERENQQTLLLMKRKKRSVWGIIAGILIAAVVAMILFESFFPLIVLRLPAPYQVPLNPYPAPDDYHLLRNHGWGILSIVSN